MTTKNRRSGLLFKAGEIAKRQRVVISLRNFIADDNFRSGRFADYSSGARGVASINKVSRRAGASGSRGWGIGQPYSQRALAAQVRP